MFVICAGMYRSGSTWQYQVVTHLLERAGGCERLGFLEGPAFSEAARRAADAPWRVLKAHLGHLDFAALLAEGKAVGVYCYRDLRDTVFSIAHKQNRRFAESAEWDLAACKASFAFWTAQPGVLVQRYDVIVGQPDRAVRELADFLKVILSLGEDEAIAREYSLEANRKRTDVLRQQLAATAVDLSDPANALLHDSHSQLHWNHIREGIARSWRNHAGPAERAFLARACGRWLVDHEFETDPLWARIDDLDRHLQQLLHQGDQLDATRAALRREAAAVREELDRLLGFLNARPVDQPDHVAVDERRSAA